MPRPTGSTTFTKVTKTQAELLFGALPNFELLVSTKQLKELAENTGMNIASLAENVPTIPSVFVPSFGIFTESAPVANPVPEPPLAEVVPNPLRFSVE